MRLPLPHQAYRNKIVDILEDDDEDDDAVLVNNNRTGTGGAISNWNQPQHQNQQQQQQQQQHNDHHQQHHQQQQQNFHIDDEDAESEHGWSDGTGNTSNSGNLAAEFHASGQSLNLGASGDNLALDMDSDEGDGEIYINSTHGESIYNDYKHDVGDDGSGGDLAAVSEHEAPPYLGEVDSPNTISRDSAHQPSSNSRSGETSVDPSQYLGYRGAVSKQPRVARYVPEAGQYPDPSTDPAYFTRNSKRQENSQGEGIEAGPVATPSHNHQDLEQNETSDGSYDNQQIDPHGSNEISYDEVTVESERSFAEQPNEPEPLLRPPPAPPFSQSPFSMSEPSLDIFAVEDEEVGEKGEEYHDDHDDRDNRDDHEELELTVVEEGDDMEDETLELVDSERDFAEADVFVEGVDMHKTFPDVNRVEDESLEVQEEYRLSGEHDYFEADLVVETVDMSKRSPAEVPQVVEDRSQRSQARNHHDDIYKDEDSSPRSKRRDGDFSQRDDSSRRDSHRDDKPQADARNLRRSDSSRSDSHRSDSRRSDSRSESHRSERRRSGSHRSDSHRSGSRRSGRSGPQYISNDPSNDPNYDVHRDPRVEMSPTRNRELPVHSAEFPDAEKDGSHIPPNRSSRESFFEYNEKRDKRERRLVTCLVSGLGCALVALAALSGGIVGALLLPEGDDEDDDEEDEETNISPPAASLNSVTTPVPISPTHVPTHAPTQSRAKGPSFSPTMSTLTPTMSTLAPTTKPTPIKDSPPSSAPSSSSPRPSVRSSRSAPSVSPTTTTVAPTGFQGSTFDPTFPVTDSTLAPTIESTFAPTSTISPTTLPTTVGQNERTSTAPNGTNTPTNTPSPSSVQSAENEENSSAPTASPTLCEDDGGFGFGSGCTDLAGTTNTNAPVAGNEDAILDLISSASIDGGVNAATTGTPQNRGFEWLLSDTYETSEEGQIQRYALATLYYSTFGESWTDSTGWLESEDECGWVTVGCNDDSVLTSLELRNTGIIGELPAELGLLTQLTSLVIVNGENVFRSGGGLQGRIPSELGQLTELLIFELNGHSFNSISSDVFKHWRKVEMIDLGDNEITGTIPTTLGHLTSATNVTLANNRLSGTIPTEIGNLAETLHLDLSYNSLTGSIPTEIGTLKKINGLYLDHNKLKGTIPNEIAVLGSLKSGLDLSANLLVGSLPKKIGSAKDLQVFRVDDNRLTGTVPSFKNMKDLREFYVNGNNFSGELSDGTCDALRIYPAEIAADCEELFCTCCTLCCAGAIDTCSDT